MDGVYPIVAGAVEGERKKKLLDHIKNPNEMWSAAGISAVDMSAVERQGQVYFCDFLAIIST